MGGGPGSRWIRTVSAVAALLQIDRRLLLVLRTHGHTEPRERALRAFSLLGEHAACWLLLGMAGALGTRDPERRRGWLRGLQVVTAAYGVNYGVKLTVQRRRPELPGLPPLSPVVSGLSFPSAHATTSFAAAAAYRELVPAPALYAAAGLFAFSRPYLGVHYPSDVLAGALLGTLLATAWPRGAGA
jgi:membrane-associated phospholipid phosphatase